MEGWTAPAVGMVVGLSRRVCQTGVARYNAAGMDGLEDQRGSYERITLTVEQEAELAERIEAGPHEDDLVCSLRGQDLQPIPASEFGVRRSLAAVYHLLHRLGYSYLRPRPRHRKADPQAVADFKQQWLERLAEVSEQHPDKQLRVYFKDESRFGQQCTTTAVWARTGSHPTTARQTEYEYLWVIGAVCPEAGHAEGLLSSTLNTAMINVFLSQFAATLPADEHAVMVWDGAGFHRSGQRAVPENITLIQLPLYSPELAPHWTLPLRACGTI